MSELTGNCLIGICREDIQEVGGSEGPSNSLFICGARHSESLCLHAGLVCSITIISWTAVASE